jgi:NADPH-dependent 2,4-dienoyl-CoA reductase/sulfur reductase-like enzyme
VHGRPQGPAHGGLEIIRGGKKAADKDVWEGGKILDPENGKDYRAASRPSTAARSCRCAATWGRSGARRPGSACNNRIEWKKHVPIQVRKVAVLGAGVMGAQIAAHLVNVKVPVVLFDLPAKEGPKNGIVLKPSPT